MYLNGIFQRQSSKLFVQPGTCLSLKKKKEKKKNADASGLDRHHRRRLRNGSRNRQAPRLPRRHHLPSRFERKGAVYRARVAAGQQQQQQ